ncbi:MAG: prepilin-type N-terminal cleavage/methylation domain-containing protein [Spirochaetales bacterium]|jgi:prepilin-type N-terminal cleavage/methylation domain-containing protein|nr:prepilin-type N-terminal cleavage/methylation domain-containing protein [Spirochaetales bacterium]
MNILTKNQNGFTLVELLIALVIFTVGILGVATMQITSIQGNSKGRQISEATNVGADRIERLLSWNYDHPALIDDDDGKDETDADADVDNGDGTGEDADNNGTDDDDGNFGLDDLANPDGAADRDGDGVNDIFWNIAVDHPVPNTKTIKFFIDPPGSGKSVEMTYIKADII